MKSLKKYVYVFEWFAAAILFAVALYSVFEPQILVSILGLLFIIFGLFRVIPLIRTTESKLIKWLVLLEIIINIGAGACLLYFAKDIDKQTDLIGYLVGGILYLRGFMHLLATSVKHEPTTLINFLVNIGLLSTGTAIIFNGGFNAERLAIFFLIISILSGAVLCFKGYKDYRNYRGNLVSDHITKKAKKSKTVETNPTSDEIIINVPEEDQPSVRA